MVKVLVTGANGFLGLYLVEQLVARGDEVRALCRNVPEELSRLPVEIHRGDIRDVGAVTSACSGREVVFHAAGVAGIAGPWKHFFSINTQGTRNIVQACREQSVAKLVYTSSPSVTFDAADQRGINESAPYPSRWLCAYPHTKALAEQDVLQANGRDGLFTCALRPHLIWGPRDRHLIPRLIARARNGQLRRVGDGHNRIDTIYVENAATAHLQAADHLQAGSPVAGRAYFISQGQPINCWKWIDDILALAGLPPVRQRISFRAAWTIGHALELAYRCLGRTDEPRMTRFLAAQLAKDHYFDIHRAQADFHFQPQVSMDEGMRRLKAWIDSGALAS